MKDYKNLGCSSSKDEGGVEEEGMKMSTKKRRQGWETPSPIKSFILLRPTSGWLHPHLHVNMRCCSSDPTNYPARVDVIEGVITHKLSFLECYV